MEQYFEKFSNRIWKPLEVTNCGIQQTKLKTLSQYAVWRVEVLTRLLLYYRVKGKVIFSLCQP